MKLIYRLLYLFLGMLLSTSVHAKTSNIQQNLDEYLQHLQQYGRFNGNVLIAQGDNILYETAIGYSDVQMKRNMTKDNLFKVGSITKQLTATTILRLYEQKALDLSTKISQYYPKLKLSNDITIAMLLNHTAGISRDVSLREESNACKSNNLVNRIIKTSKTYQPTWLCIQFVFTHKTLVQ